VKTAIPIAVGDNLRGYRIVGTVPELFDEVEYAPGKKFAVAAGGSFSQGRRCARGGRGQLCRAAARLKVGDTFQPHHGLSVRSEKNRARGFLHVVGILAPTNTPVDRVIWIPLKGVQTMSGHDPKAATDVSAVLLQLRAPTAGFMLDMMYNKQGNKLTFAYPVGAIIAELFGQDRVVRPRADARRLPRGAGGGGLGAGEHLQLDERAARATSRSCARSARGGGRFSAPWSREAACIGALGAAAGFAVYFGCSPAWRKSSGRRPAWCSPWARMASGALDSVRWRCSWACARSAASCRRSRRTARRWPRRSRPCREGRAKPTDQIPAKIKALDQAKVAVTGFMLPTKMDKGLVKEFLLVKDAMMCCYGAMPKVNEWIVVKMNGAGVKPLMDIPITFEGRLKVGEMFENGYLTGLYLLEGDRLVGVKG
jgi:hypothetical protein